MQHSTQLSGRGPRERTSWSHYIDWSMWIFRFFVENVFTLVISSSARSLLMLGTMMDQSWQAWEICKICSTYYINSFIYEQEIFPIETGNILYRSKKYLLPLVDLAVYPVPVWLAGVLEVRAGPGHDHLQEDVQDRVQGLAVPVSVWNTPLNI